MQATLDNHDCHWRSKAQELSQRIEQLERMLFGKRSEKMPSVKASVQGPINHSATQEVRSNRRAERISIPEVRYEHTVADSKKHCPKCGSKDFKKLGEGKLSTLIEYVPAHLERQVHVQETLACCCGEYVVSAQGPVRPQEGGHYGPGLMAHVVTAKCVDSIPLYRMEKQFKRAGLTLSRSTLCNLFHHTAQALKPIYDHMLAKMPGYSLVLADETPLPVQEDTKTHKGFMWSFINDDYILYRYSRTRNSLTPSMVLKDSQGTLLADGFSGYNQVCAPEGRLRAGCWAHARRKFFEAKATAPQAQAVLDSIKALYQIEYDAANANMMGSPQHLIIRQQRALPLLLKLKNYLEEQAGIHPPKSTMGKAIAYTLNNWAELTRFTEDQKLPLDNNASERALRIIALGRKNYLFAGNDTAAENLAGLYSLVATCELHGVNPQQYLADVLIKVHTQPQSQIHELLPHLWKVRTG